MSAILYALFAAGLFFCSGVAHDRAELRPRTDPARVRGFVQAAALIALGGVFLSAALIL